MSGVLSAADVATLVDVAEATLRVALAEGRRVMPDPAEFPARLRAPGAAFVTMRREEMLLGCIGTLEPVAPLVQVVADRTLAAAFSDPRTRGVHVADWEVLDVEVSVLSRPEPLTIATYDHLVVHVAASPTEGLLVEAGRARATFLPSVHEQLPDPDEFVAALWHKAGLSPRAWPTGIEVHRYTAVKGIGHPPRPPLQ